jgi:hypothetical protein
MIYKFCPECFDKFIDILPEGTYEYHIGDVDFRLPSEQE